MNSFLVNEIEFYNILSCDIKTRYNYRAVKLG